MTKEDLTLRTIIRHRDFLQYAMKKITTRLDERAIIHDASKMLNDEFIGFCNINEAAMLHEFGSEAYKEALKKEKDVIDLHYSRNSHHPEYHGSPDHIGILDLIEMVCDWWAAWKTYESSLSWLESLEVQRKRYGNKFNSVQWNNIFELANLMISEDYRL